MPTSFRRGSRIVPARYRTPSPPRDAVEPISPTTAENTTIQTQDLSQNDDARTNHGIKRSCPTHQEYNATLETGGTSSTGAMDTFTSIALATDSGSTHRPLDQNHIQLETQEYTERPSKRAKSENIFTPDWPSKSAVAESRPATSYEQSPEDRQLEAELLLNFAQAAAKLTTPSPVVSHADLKSQRRISETTDGVPHQHPLDDYTNDERTQNGTTASGRHDSRRSVDSNRSLPPDLVTVTEAPSCDVEPPDPTHSIAERPSESQYHQDCLASEISRHDERDLLPQPGGLDEIEASARNQHPGNPEAPSALEESQPHISSRSLEHVSPNEATLPATTIRAPLEPALLCDDTLQIENKGGLEEEGDARLKDETIEIPNLLASQQLPEESTEHESRLMNGPLGDNVDKSTQSNSEYTALPVLETGTVTGTDSDTGSTPTYLQPTMASAVCTACNFVRNSVGVEADNNSTSWISCDACKAWFHFACAGFKNEREVRAVDKFRCRKCKVIHGATTYVRKSSRAHSAIDYAGLHQGVIKTSDERPEHHYIKPIKEGSITFLPETFARMRPELVTAEFFEKGAGMKEPIVIPSCLNPRSTKASGLGEMGEMNKRSSSQPLEDDNIAEDWFSPHPDSETVPDHGQDALDMVIPKGLTVRQVAELYGPEEKVEVIDVKSQNGENKKWNMRRWADYYENPSNKVVRNVISLEVSQSRLGRLIRRPQIVRDLDLQDTVWPEDLLAKGEYPRVQFYCLMSVADCFTDFHIDFGGSSVFYHILKGKKTFLFIPPKEKNLKKYEEWCQSPAQNWTFLGDQTKECYRVDLSEGDTMLIPSGWIHAVWTPEDSLVIGGNFLTRMNFGMQLRIAQVEKATGVARKFRYPHFQKLHWYTALKYLETDPLPDQVCESLHAGGSFLRERPAYHDFDSWGENSRAGRENYHARYYSQSELDGLPELTRYLLRTALIDIGSITDGISADTRNAVKKSIPRAHGEPLDILKSFAAWCAWKRGNEPIPHWAYPDAVPEDLAPDKLSAAAMKKLDREAALSAPRRQSARMQSQQQQQQQDQQQPVETLDEPIVNEMKTDASHFDSQEQTALAHSSTPKRPRLSAGTGVQSHRKTACESCRKRRRACKHKDQIASSLAASAVSLMGYGSAGVQTNVESQASSLVATPYTPFMELDVKANGANQGMNNDRPDVQSPYHLSTLEPVARASYVYGSEAISNTHAPEDVRPGVPTIELQMSGDAIRGLESGLSDSMQARPRHKACNECRKSKRRCIHDAFGNEDPVKVRETAIPRPHARKSHILAKNDAKPKKPAASKESDVDEMHLHQPSSISIPTGLEAGLSRMAPVANMIAEPPNLETTSDAFSDYNEASIQRSIAERASQLLDPALFQDEPGNLPYDGQTIRSSPTVQDFTPEGQSHSIAVPEMSTTAEDQYGFDTSEVSQDANNARVPIEPQESLEQPASSLVSPPPSLNDDEASKIPDAPDVRWTPSRSLSEQSCTHQKRIQQGYTPDSGSMRRGSSVSCGEIMPEEDSSVQVRQSIPDQKSTMELNSSYFADEESLKLIKELQAQELGLRRRGKA